MKRIVFTSAWNVIFEDTDGAGMPEDRLILKTSHSIVSAGTELAILSGGESWAPLPFVPGYGSVGTVFRAPRGSKLKEGSLVFTYGTHSEYAPADTLTLPLPEGLAPEKAVYARMGAVAVTALRASRIELGDFTLVFGAGIVGNMAAQLAGLSGARTIIVDTCEKRLQIARDCGIEYALPAGPDTREAVREITGGRMCEAVIEATGNPAVAETAAGYAGFQGELILLGSPRGTHSADITPLLNSVHLCPQSITMKGAHEWRFPVEESEQGLWKHSITRNIRILFDLLLREKLKVAPLTTHIVPPSRAPGVYEGLRNDKENYLGVVFDWNGNREGD